MKKLFLMQNPELFQGIKYLNTPKNYFEGWYFKNTCKNSGISFIPGINISHKNPKSFIQVITNNSSYFIDYDIKDFGFCHNPFSINIGNNYFSKEGIKIDIKDKKQQININGEIRYINNVNIKTNLFNPNIMGPFSYIPFMECNHCILSMKNQVYGHININGNKLIFNNGIGYIEKDWGYSFPKSYVWCQGNNFKDSTASFMLSIADIPFKIFNFTGVICVLIIDNIEYKFTTYNNCKIVEYNIIDKSFNITLKKDNYFLNIYSTYDSRHKLFAPVKGMMKKNIFESISSSITVTLKKNNEIIFSNTSNNCGLEIVQN